MSTFPPLSLLLLLLLPPPFSYFLSLSFSPSLCADERQALSRQWHSKTSGLGSSVSGYSTLLGAISLSKVWPAYSPTENPQISYYTLHTEGRHSCSLAATGVCMCAQKTAQRQIKMSKFEKFGYEEEREMHAWLWVYEREGKWERAGVLVWEPMSGCMCAANLWAVDLMLTWPHLPKVSTRRGQVHSQTPKAFSPITALKRYSTTTHFFKSLQLYVQYVPDTLSGISIYGTHSQILTCSHFAN